MLEPLLTETQKAHDTVSISNYFYIGDQQADGMSIYFYLDKVYGANISGGLSIGKELTSILGKGKSKKEKVRAYGGIDIVETTKWNTPDFRVVYAEGKYAAPTYLEVIYSSISKFIQKPILKIYIWKMEPVTPNLIMLIGARILIMSPIIAPR